MKGMFAILGCLLAAYAAPLFGNEVPLILEETIQLPNVPWSWDVASDSNGSYYWMIGSALGYDSTVATYGSLNSGTIHTFEPRPGFTGAVRIAARVGENLLLREVFKPSNWWNWPYGGYPPSTRLEVFSSNNLFTALKDIRSEGETLAGGPPYFELVQILYPYRLCLGWPDCSSQDSSRQLTIWRTRVDHSESNLGSDSHRFSNLLDDEANEFEESNISQVFSARSADWQIEVALIELEVTDPFHIVHYYCGTSLYDIAAGTPVVAQHLYDYKPYAVTIHSEENYPVLLVSRAPFDSLRGWTPDGGLLWAIADVYPKQLVANVLESELAEQFLLLQDGSRQFDVVIAETGRIWGRTSPLDSDFAEMKIIGRYHNETRRLVVRYGSELRIYRFGDPILDADDSRPELPNELSLSAYPNPFNPVTNIAFDLPTTLQAQLVVYDLTGRAVQTLFNERINAGHHEYAFNGANLPSGLYFARLEAGNITTTQKLVLLK
ncbi:MAG: T9SS type A sorting domain-containing protein [Calditrichaeota bacterium]|nr:T9SS type A sorting domain-containing protein [Calditrichota bacterium]